MHLVQRHETCDEGMLFLLCGDLGYVGVCIFADSWTSDLWSSHQSWCIHIHGLIPWLGLRSVCDFHGSVFLFLSSSALSRVWKKNGIPCLKKVGIKISNVSTNRPSLWHFLLMLDGLLWIISTLVCCTVSHWLICLEPKPLLSLDYDLVWTRNRHIGTTWMLKLSPLLQVPPKKFHCNIFTTAPKSMKPWDSSIWLCFQNHHATLKL